VRTLELVNNLRSELVANFARRIYSTHEAEGGVDQLADHAGRREFAHSCEREHAVDVALGVARRITEVPHAQLVRARVNRDAAIRRVLVMKARLIAIHDSAGAEQRNSAFGHRFGERRERCEIVFDPSVRGEIAVKIACAWNVCDRHVGARHSLRWRRRIRQTATRFDVRRVADHKLLQRSDVWLGEIFILREAIAASEPQIIRRLHAGSQQMSKRHVSEECGGY
jgi:hypothetical protein